MLVLMPDRWVAHIAVVKVDKSTGKVKVVSITCAQDMGLCINPEGAHYPDGRLYKQWVSGIHLAKKSIYLKEVKYLPIVSILIVFTFLMASKD